MANAWDDREKALEDGYFRQKDNELIARMRAKITNEKNVSNFNCPKCSGKLQTGNFENVSIDVCDTCGGVWLDAGELEQITRKEEKHGFLGRLSTLR